MKYTLEELVNAPLLEFTSKMDDPKNMIKWQRGLVKYEFTEGEPCKDGSQMKLYYDTGKRKFELLETVLENKLPHEFHATYVMPGVHNLQKNYFTQTPDGKTKWVSVCEFTSDKLLMKLMMTLFPGLFKKQSKIIMSDLKEFVENGTSVEGLT